MQRLARAQPAGRLRISSTGTLIFKEQKWKDVETKLDPPDGLDLRNKRLQLVVIVQGNPGNLRFAAGQDTKTQQYANVGEFIFSVKAGCNAYAFSVDEMRTLRGAPDYAAVNHLAIGGENENSEMLVHLADELGRPILDSFLFFGEGDFNRRGKWLEVAYSLLRRGLRRGKSSYQSAGR